MSKRSAKISIEMFEDGLCRVQSVTEHLGKLTVEKTKDEGETSTEVMCRALISLSSHFASEKRRDKNFTHG